MSEDIDGKQAVKHPRSSGLLRVSVAFVIGGALLTVIAALVAVYVLGWYDSKFRDGLDSALQVKLTGMALALVIASAVFVVMIAILARTEELLNRSASVALILGSAYPIGLLLVERCLRRLDPESLVVVVAALGYMVLYPMIAAVVAKKRATLRRA